MDLYRLMMLLVITVGTMGCEKQGQSTLPPLTTAPSPVMTTTASPRYQIVFSPHLRADTFLLDTQKGRVWVRVKFSDLVGEPEAFDEFDVIDSTGEIGMNFSDFSQLHSSAQAKDRKNRKPPRRFSEEELNSTGKSTEPKGGKK